MKRIYLDLCSLQRPLDTKSQIRIAIEAEAVLGMIRLWELEQIELISSESLMFEAEQNTNPVRKAYILEILTTIQTFVKISPVIEHRAKKFVEMGIKPMDSLHLSSAIEAGADYFCTCDDRFLKRAKTIDTSLTKVFSPTELGLELEI